LLTCNCIIKGTPVLFNKEELIEYLSGSSNGDKEIKSKGTLAEYWLGCPLMVGEHKIGAIVVQSYEKEHTITKDDRDLLGFVSDLLAMMIEHKRLEAERLEYQINLETKIDERTKELFYAKEKAESATKTKSEFLANMSHELRTPLNAIIGFCEILIEDATEIKQKSFVDDLNKIHRSGNHLLALINDILDLSKIDVKKMDVNIDSFNLQDMLQNVIETLEPYANINNNNIRLNIPEKDVTLRSDERKIRQILFNLISNACKHSEVSTIDVTVQEKENNNNRYLSFNIKDTGEGIPKIKLEQIFEPFCQADSTDTRQGTGLGLTLAKAYTELLGGNIYVESKEGIGSTFTSEILQDYWASKEQKAQISLEEIREITPSSQKEKILVIDDDIIFLDLINTRLVKEGFTVYTANSGHRGLQKAKQILPDIIILDIVMPDIDGWTVYKNLKSTPLLSEIPVVIITIGDYQKMAKDFGVVDFLAKPINWKLLSKILEQYKTVTKSRYILVVDDDSATRIILRKMLVKDGWRVEEAKHGKDAISCIEKDKPELILLDLLMPVMDGFEFLNIVNDNDKLKKIPIIVITSKDLTEEDYSFLTTNVDQVIQKGKYTRKELIGRIDTAIKASNLKTYQKGN
jgi:signal transduction histidine kinase/CheY-like chemotaxis protein